MHEVMRDLCAMGLEEFVEVPGIALDAGGGVVDGRDATRRETGVNFGLRVWIG